MHELHKQFTGCATSISCWLGNPIMWERWHVRSESGKSNQPEAKQLSSQAASPCKQPTAPRATVHTGGVCCFCRAVLRLAVLCGVVLCCVVLWLFHTKCCVVLCCFVDSETSNCQAAHYSERRVGTEAYETSCNSICFSHHHHNNVYCCCCCCCCLCRK